MHTHTTHTIHKHIHPSLSLSLAQTKTIKSVLAEAPSLRDLPQFAEECKKTVYLIKEFDSAVTEFNATAKQQRVDEAMLTRVTDTCKAMLLSVRPLHCSTRTHSLLHTNRLANCAATTRPTTKRLLRKWSTSRRASRVCSLLSRATATAAAARR
jgi:hypothetical protein